MEKELSETIGLSQQETAVYISLLQLGKASATKIAKNSKINRTTVYYSLDKLIEKGLVSFINIKETKYFTAIDPELLKNIIEIQKKDTLLKLSEKENQLDGIIPQLKILQNIPKEDLKIEVLEGRQSVRNYVDRVVKTIIDENINELLSINDTKPGFLREYLKYERNKILKDAIMRLKDKNVESKWLFIGPKDRDDPDEISKFTGVRKYIYSKVQILTNTQVYGDYLDIIVVPKKPIIITIKNKFVADTFRAMFNVIWNMK